jgi:hypothetical protein
VAKVVRRDSSGLQVVELNYHASGEGKTGLDAHFGHLKTMRHKRERMKLERRTIGDLLTAMAEVEATHVVHVELDRKDETRFYHTAKGINSLHRVVVARDGMHAQDDSHQPLGKLKLDKVKERKTARARAVRAREHADVVHLAQADECQKCHNQVKKGERLEEWIQCEGCMRSWHKTCVGIEVDTPLDQVAWSKCRNCNGNDPEGEMLVKRRKAQVCSVCGQRKRGLDHRQCQQRKVQQATEFRTPKATLVSTVAHGSVARKKNSLAGEKRAKRRPRKLRKRKGRRVSEEEYQQLMARI